MTVEECRGCYFLNSRNFDGKVGCSRTGSLLEDKKVCLDNGPFVRMPRTPAELEQIIEISQGRLKKVIDFPDKAIA